MPAIAVGDFVRNPTARERDFSVESVRYHFDAYETKEIIHADDVNKQRWAMDVLMAQAYRHGLYLIDPKTYQRRGDAYIAEQDNLGKQRYVATVHDVHKGTHEIDNLKLKQGGKDLRGLDPNDELEIAVADETARMLKIQGGSTLEEKKEALLKKVREAPATDYSKEQLFKLKKIAAERGIKVSRTVKHAEIIERLKAHDARDAMLKESAVVTGDSALNVGLKGPRKENPWRDDSWEGERGNDPKSDDDTVDSVTKEVLAEAAEDDATDMDFSK